MATTTFTRGQALDGGAVWTGEAVDLTLDHDAFSSNSSGPRNVGGAVDVAEKGTLSVIDSSFLNNSDACDSCGPDGGGAIISNGDPITVTGSTFAGNSTSGPGGAIDAGYGGKVLVTDSTFSDNTSSGGNNNLGGAIYATGTLDVVASTFVGNSATSGATIWGTETTMAASILKGVSGVATCAGPVTSAGYNLSDEVIDSCSLTAVGDRVAAASLVGLGPLAANGGPTMTIMPLGGSPVVGVIPSNTTVQVDGQSTPLCPTTDQRGVTTPSTDSCAAGSVQGRSTRDHLGPISDLRGGRLKFVRGDSRWCPRPHVHVHWDASRRGDVPGRRPDCCRARRRPQATSRSSSPPPTATDPTPCNDSL